MQPRIDTNLGIQGEPDAWVHSACILCSNGCGVDIAVKDGRIAGVRGTADHPVNFGHLGPKGEHGWVANNSKRRGTTPLIRRTKGASLQPVSWAEAMDFFTEKFTAAWQQGHENLACYNSGQLTIEEFYTLGKLWRGGLQSSNIDGNTRLCTATSPAEWIGTTPRMVSTVLQGFYQSVEATASSSLVNTVHLLTGAIGRPGAGPLLMAGQPAAMCNREAGAGGSYPGYRNPHSEAQMRDLCERWNLDFDQFHPEVPKDILLMMETAERGEIEFMWVIGTNPLVSLPDQNRSERILRRLFLVVQDPFLDAETVDLADIYFPAAMWGEKMGCVTNADRSVNLLLKATDPPGEARSDFDIFVEVANWLKFKDRDGAPLIPFKEPKDAFEEWRKVSQGRPCDYSGMSYDLILQMGAVRWPCNEQHPSGCERLYEDLKFWTGIDECESYGADFLTGNQNTRSDYERIDPKGKAFLRPVQWRRQPNPTSDDYPFVLITGRVVYHFHTRTKTGRSVALNERAPHAYVEMHPADAARLEIGLGDLVEITSPNGRWEGVAMVVDTVRPGEVFVPFHYGHGSQSANQHTWYARDPISHQPQLKSSPVAVRRLGFGQPEPWLLARLAELNGDSTVPFAAQEFGGTVNRAVQQSAIT